MEVEFERVAMLLHVVEKSRDYNQLKNIHDTAMTELSLINELMIPPKPEPEPLPELEAEESSEELDLDTLNEEDEEETIADGDAEEEERRL